jgi:Asp/Glu/hydantoin racemase
VNLLIINPNTTPEITALVLREATKLARPGTRLAAATGRFGAAYVASRAAFAIAGHAALDAYAEHGAGCDGVLLACFGDPGLDALKELSEVPVVGLAEASIAAAAENGRRFSIVTGGARWGPMLEEFVAARGLAGRLASVVTVAPTGAEIARDPDRALAALAAACRDAAERDGAEAVILGGAGLAGLSARIAADVPVPLIDGLAAGLAALEAAVAAGWRKPADGPFTATPPVESAGLSPALAAKLAGG